VEPQFPDLPAEVPAVGLAEVLGVFGEQADEEVDPAEVAVGQAGQPGSDFRLDLDLIQSLSCICCYRQGGAISRAGGLVSGEDVVRVAPHSFGLGGSRASCATSS
jgi:hypothetical protein